MSPKRTRPIFYHFAAIKFLWQNKSLLRFIVYPLAINTVVFAVLLTIAAIFYQDWLFNWIQPGSAWYMAMLYGAVLAITTLLSLVIMFFIFSAVGSIIAAPFNDELSLHIEEIYHEVSLNEDFEWEILVKDVGRTVKEQTQRLLYFGMMWIAILPLWIVPFVWPVVFLTVTVTFLGWEYLDISLSRHRLGFHQKRRLLMKHLRPMFLFGLVCAGFLAIPFINLLSIPLSVVGGTLFYCERLREEVVAVKEISGDSNNEPAEIEPMSS